MKVKKLTTVVALLMMLVLFVTPLTPSAATTFLNEKGSITLTLEDPETEKPLSGVTFRLYFFAKAYKSGGGVRYEMIPPYDESGLEADNPEDSSLPVHLTYFAFTNSQPYTEKSTDEKGILVFENLIPGLYLVVPMQSSEDSHTSSPFVVSVPGYDSEKKEWEYNIDASPKISDGEGNEGDSETYLSVVKKWKTNSSHPESITVVLLRDFQEYVKVELNAGNNWYYRFDNLPENHIWNVVEESVPDGYKVYYEASSNTVTIINKSEDFQEEGTTKPSEGETEEDKLVQTGQLNWPVPICAISGLVIFSIGWAVLNFGRKESE